MAAAALAAWRGSGDIESLAIAPIGVGFVIETKTRRTTVVISLGCPTRPPGCRGGVGGGVDAARCQWFAHVAVQRLEQNVLVVSIDQLVPVLRSGVRPLGRPPDELGMRGLFGSASVSNEPVARAAPLTDRPNRVP